MLGLLLGPIIILGFTGWLVFLHGVTNIEVTVKKRSHKKPIKERFEIKL